VARKVLQPWGVTVRVVPPTPDPVRAAAGPDTVAVWVETVANPSGTVPDLPALAEVAHAAGAPLMVDNTFGCAGFLCRPIDHGADVVMHSATKWINGHGTALAGALIDAGRFEWDTERVVYPGLPNHPSHDAATRMLSGGLGGVLSFELDGEERARACLDALKLVSRVANLGESRTLAIHPWTTTHAGLSEEARRAAGVTPGLVRVSVGLEAIDAIQADLAQALVAAPLA